MKRICLSWLTMAAIILTVAGCSRQMNSLPQRQHVKGTITYNNKPLEGATVTFWPLPLSANNWKTVKPIAIVQSDGSFEPNSYDEKDGAVIGEYALTVIYRLSRTSPDVFAGRFSDATRPILKVTVKEGENILPPIHLAGTEINTQPKDLETAR